MSGATGRSEYADALVVLEGAAAGTGEVLPLLSDEFLKSGCQFPQRMSHGERRAFPMSRMRPRIERDLSGVEPQVDHQGIHVSERELYSLELC